MFVSSQGQIETLFYQANCDILGLTCFNGEICEIDLETPVSPTPDRRANVIFGAYITAAAREHTYKALVAVIQSGGQLYACDTDSIYFTQETGREIPLDVSAGIFGAYKFEYPSESITSFSSIGKKSICLTFQDNNQQLSHVVKVKGLSLNAFHGNQLTHQEFKDLLQSYVEEEEKVVTIKQGRMIKKKNFGLGRRMVTFKIKSLLHFGRVVDKNTLKTFAYGERVK